MTAADHSLQWLREKQKEGGSGAPESGAWQDPSRAAAAMAASTDLPARHPSPRKGDCPVLGGAAFPRPWGSAVGMLPGVEGVRHPSLSPFLGRLPGPEAALWPPGQCSGLRSVLGTGSLVLPPGLGQQVGTTAGAWAWLGYDSQPGPGSAANAGPTRALCTRRGPS